MIWLRKLSSFRASLFLVGGCLLLLGGAIFRDCLFGNATLLYKDIGSDSLNDYYPTLVHLADYIRKEGLPSWSFSVGMGQDLYYLVGFLWLHPLVWLPRTLIASGLVYEHLAKVLVIGLLFYSYLRIRGVVFAAALLGSFFLSFSAYVCMGSCWLVLADETLAFSALLLAAELAVKRGVWWLLTLAVCVVALVGSFHIYLAGVLLCFYVPWRLWEIHGWSPRLLGRICLVSAGAAFLGLTLSAVVTIPHLYAVLHSPRGGGVYSLSKTLRGSPLFHFASQLSYLSSLQRMFSNDILGTGDNFRGWANYLESPITYCGLPCLLLLPQAFVRVTFRRRVVASMLLVGLLVPTIFPWFRHLFWAFQGDYYRTYSLFWILGFITLSMLALSCYFEGKPLSLILLAVTLACLLGSLFLPLAGLEKRISGGFRLEVVLLLCLYSLFLGLGQFLQKPRLATCCLILLAVGELISFDRLTVAGRSVVTKDDLKSRTGYNDQAADAVRDLKLEDADLFYRLMKPRSSAPSAYASLNDAMIFGYYGTSSYSSFNNANYADFLISLQAMSLKSEGESRWAVGLVGFPLASLFSGEKYFLDDNATALSAISQYEYLRPYGRYHLFRNRNNLPFGVTFDHYLSEAEFAPLPPSAKSGVLLGTVVLSKEVAAKYNIPQIGVSELEASLRAAQLSGVVELRRRSGVRLTSFRQSAFEGVVTLTNQSILVFQTPFDQGWNATVDGQPAAQTLKADFGLLGVVLEQGTHKIGMHYRTPFLRMGAVITLISLLTLGVGIWKRPMVAVKG